MSTIRTAWRSATALAVVAVAIPAIGILLATPAAAFCFLGCGHGGLMSAMFARPQTAHSIAGPAHSIAVPANQPIARLHVRQQLSSTRSHSTTNVGVSRSVPSRSLVGGSAAAKTLPANPSVAKKRQVEEMRVPSGLSDVSAGGPSATNTSFTVPATPGASAGGNGVPGGFVQGGGNGTFSGSSGSAPSGGNLTSGLAPSSASGGSSQSTSANGPNRSPGGGSTVDSGPTTRRPSTNGSAATKTNSGAMTLTAVTACVTPVGSCLMERDVGTACQCKDMQGNVYDGIVK